MEQKNYTPKECRAFNQKSLELTNKFAKGNFKNAECKELILPDDVHPWNILYSVIDQFYKREYERAQLIDIAHCELMEAKELIADVREHNELYRNMQKEISILKQENEKLTEDISQMEKRVQEQPKALQELIDYCGIDELIDNTGEILDWLIRFYDHSSSKGLANPMFYTRQIQKFFIELEKEQN